MRTQKGCIGVDIGTHTIKMAQVEKRNGKLKLIDAALISRQQPWSVNGWQKPTPMTSADELMAAYSVGQKFQGRNAASMTSMALCDVRSINIPQGNRKQSLEAISGRFEEIERLNIHNRQFDYWEIPNEWKSRTRDNIYVLSMENSWAEQVAEDHSRAGLTCKCLDGNPMALARAANMIADQPTTAILDWGYTRATFCIQKMGTPVFVRMLRDSGLKQTIETLAETLSVSLDQASKLLSEHGVTVENEVASDIQKIISSSVSTLSKQITEELVRTVGHLRRSNGAEIPEELVLFGGGSTIKNICQRLEPKLPFSLKQWTFAKPRDNFRWPMQLFGPAVALSALGWSSR